jgi:hypothetical protein
LGKLEVWDIRDDSYGAIAGFVIATLIMAIPLKTVRVPRDL